MNDPAKPRHRERLVGVAPPSTIQESGRLTERRSFFTELKRRNVIRAAVLYGGAAWALAQGIAQLVPVVNAPEWTARWFLVAACIGFPFWLAFAWFYEWTPEGFEREDKVEARESITHHTGRKLDFAIIGVLALAVVLLLTELRTAPRCERGGGGARELDRGAAVRRHVAGQGPGVLLGRNLRGTPEPACQDPDFARGGANLVVLVQGQERRDPGDRAAVTAFRGDADHAFEWLDKAVQYGDTGLSDIPFETVFDNIKQDPRWLPFLRKLGMAPEQLAAIKFDAKVPK